MTCPLFANVALALLINTSGRVKKAKMAKFSGEFGHFCFFKYFLEKVLSFEPLLFHKPKRDFVEYKKYKYKNIC